MNTKKIVHDAVILTAFTLVLGFLLGLVYEVTKKPIADANNAAAQAAYKEVFGCDYCDNKTKPSNEKLVSDLFDEVMSEVKCKKTQCEPAPVKESVFDSLMAEIDDLF